MFGIVCGDYEIIRDTALQTVNGELGYIGYINRRAAFYCAGSRIRRARRSGFVIQLVPGQIRLGVGIPGQGDVKCVYGWCNGKESYKENAPEESKGDDSLSRGAMGLPPNTSMAHHDRTFQRFLFLRAKRSIVQKVLLSPGNPATVFRLARNVGQWLCVLSFRIVCLYQAKSDLAVYCD